MKKIITILLFFVITGGEFLFSSTSNLKLNGDVEIVPYELSLLYGDLFDTATKIENGTTFEQEEEIDLTINGKTKVFYIVYTGNQNSLAKINFSVDAQPFIPVNIDTAGVTYKDSDTVPLVKGDNIVLKPISAGYKNNELFAAFEYVWEGKPNLTAGKYQSNITVSYTIE